MKVSELKETIKELVRESLNEKKEKWIQKAVDPKHKGYCTPMTKPTCTPRRKALAKRFKKGIEKENSAPKDYQGENDKMHKMEDEAVVQTPKKYFDPKTKTVKDVNWISIQKPGEKPEQKAEKGKIGEVAPPGFGPGKQHADIYSKVKKQYGADSPKAYATMWSIYNKMSEAVNMALQECGCEEEMDEAGLTSEVADSKISMLDDIAKLVVQKKGAEDPAKVEYLVSQIFQKQYGKPADPEAVKSAVQKQLPLTEAGASYKVVAKTQARTQKDDQAKKMQDTPKMTEAKGPSYKVVAQTQAQTQKDDQAKKVQDEPKVNETAYKVQGPSYKTFKDSPKGDTAYKDDPKNA